MFLKNNDKNFSTKTEDLKSAIDRVSAVAINEEMKSKAIKLILNQNKLLLSVESQTKGFADEELDVNYNQDDVEIGFNSKYLIDICNEVDGEDINVSILDPISPAIIEDKSDENSFFVLMPMHRCRSRNIS